MNMLIESLKQQLIQGNKLVGIRKHQSYITEVKKLLVQQSLLQVLLNGLHCLLMQQ